MALTSEDGTGVSGSESYYAIAGIDAYWAARTHNPLAAIWAAATTAKKEGAAREATAFTDATWGAFYLGTRKSYSQGLEWPRNGDLDTEDADADGLTTDFLPLTDINGTELPALPPQLQWAVAELAARAVTAPLAADIDTGKVVARVKAGSTEVEFAPSVAAAPSKVYGVVEKILTPILSGAQGGAASWGWR